MNEHDEQSGGPEIEMHLHLHVQDDARGEVVQEFMRMLMAEDTPGHDSMMEALATMTVIAKGAAAAGAATFHKPDVTCKIELQITSAEPTHPTLRIGLYAPEHEPS